MLIPVAGQGICYLICYNIILFLFNSRSDLNEGISQGIPWLSLNSVLFSVGHAKASFYSSEA